MRKSPKAHSKNHFRTKTKGNSLRIVLLDYSFYEYGCIPGMFKVFRKVRCHCMVTQRRKDKTNTGGHVYFLGQKYQLWSDTDIVKTSKQFASMDSPIPVDRAFDELCEDPKSARKIFPEGRIYVMYEAWGTQGQTSNLNKTI